VSIGKAVSARILTTLQRMNSMRHISKFATGVALLGISMGAAAKSYGPSAEANALRATAVIHGAPGSGISGVVSFTQAPADKDSPVTTVDVVAHIDGLPPGRHGMHIHEVGACTDTTIPFGGAGGHFDPGPFGSSLPVDANHPFHMGDLPNIEVNGDGAGHLHYTTSRITLSVGPLSVFDLNGSAVVIHQNEDLGLTGVTGAGGGPRIACGVIQ
jgi:Cu-Zn family superoxide dismutase